MNWIRHIAPWILLAVYLPVVALSSTHVHHDTIDLHDDCQQCVGHIEVQHHHDSDCQYCQFLSLNYFSQTFEASSVHLPAIEAYTLSSYEPTVQAHYGVSQLRAPPMN